MKFTQYFLYTHQREDRKGIELKWIEEVVANPIKEEGKAMDAFGDGGKFPKLGTNIFALFCLKMGKSFIMHSLIERSGR
jgi:hypothetical protein